MCSALLETLGLLPSQRRIFLSYKRSESRQAALQLADTLADLQFDVFLGTRGVPPAVNFQDMLFQERVSQKRLNARTCDLRWLTWA